jgi:hypothetical protein
MGSITLWTEDEINYIKENYEEFGPKKCSIKLNRPISGCRIKSKELNITFDRSFKYRENSLRKIIEHSLNISDCLRKLKLTIRPGNYTTIRKYIKLYNIDISHFDYTKNNNRLKNFSIKNRISTEDILVENSTYSRQHLKKRLYSEGLKERICELCGQDEMWKGSKISLILDHINGVNNDNRIENLRIVCPNCNAGLLTHCGKNKEITKKVYYCKCGDEKYKQAKQCKKCYGISQRKTDRPSLSQLLQDIEDTNYTQTGKKYNVSDNAIRKWIKNYQG